MIGALVSQRPPSADAMSPASAGIRMPTNDEMKQVYGSIARSAMRNGRAKALAGPPVKDPSSYPSWDITPTGRMDLTDAVYNIEGRLFLHKSSIFGPGGQGVSKWYDVGPAPMF